MSEATVTRRTLSVLVENAAGVLSQVSRLFSRKGYNIESLAVGTTDDPTVSRITIEVMADEAMTEQIMNQLRKQFPVYSVQELKPERSIRRELVMFKVRAETPDIRNEAPWPSSATSPRPTPCRSCWRPSASWSWCAPAWWLWSAAPTPSATRPKSRRNLIWARISCK